MSAMSRSVVSISLAAGLLGAAAAAPQAGGREGRSPPASRTAQSEAAVEQMMRADVNKDGMVTRDELERLDSRLGRRFGDADMDRDGKLTLREFEKLHELNRGATTGSGAGGTATGSSPAGTRR